MVESDSDDDRRPSKDRKNSDAEEDDDEDEEVEVDEESEEEDEREESRGKKKGKRSRSYYVDDAADDDDDEEEEEDDRKKRKKSKKSRRDEESDGEEELSDDEAEKMAAQMRNSYRRHDFLTADLTQEDLDARYRGAMHDDEAPDGITDENVKNARLPDATKDPKVWCIKVANGTEKTLVIQLMNKFVTLAKEGRPIHITCAYWNEQSLGYIYVEAYKEAFVKEALSGLRGVYATKMKLVPVKEMTDTVVIIKKSLSAQPGGWARVRRGKYKGDIVQVLAVEHNRNEV